MIQGYHNKHYVVETSIIFNIVVDINEKRDFYFGFFINRGSDREPSITITITTSESQPVNYLIEAPGVGYCTNGSVTSDNEVIINLPTTLIALSHNDQDKGIHLMTSSERVTVIGQSLGFRSSGTFLCLPITSLCVDEYVYYGISVPRASSSTFSSSILVVGAEDNTMMKLTVTQPVTISVSNSTVDLTAGIQYSFVINRLQTVLIGSSDDLTGTKIVTNKPASVLSGHECGTIPANLEFCDHLIEQVPPTILWGTVFYTRSTKRPYTLKVLTAHNITTVNVYCNNVKMSEIQNEGQVFNLNLQISDSCAVYSDKKVLVVQFSHGTEDGSNNDEIMTLVTATNQYSNKFQFSTLQGRSSYTHYINIIVLTQYYQPDMIYLISGGVNRSLDTNELIWVPIAVNSVTEAYSLSVEISAGVNEVMHSNTTALMAVNLYGYKQFEGYGNPVANYLLKGKCANNLCSFINTFTILYVIA